jgi:hypothetical protein
MRYVEVDKQERPYPDMPEERITRLAVALFNREIAAYCIGALRTHDCIVSISPESYDVFFPDGATQKELLPRIMNGRYTITLPDGFEMEAVYNRHTDLYALKLPVSILPEKLRKKYSDSWYKESRHEQI